MANQSKSGDHLFDRSDKTSSPVPRLIFCFLRAVDPYLQYLLIFNGYGHQLLSKVGIDTLPSGPKGTALVAMAAGCALKQIINMIFIFETKLPASASLIICIFIGLLIELISELQRKSFKDNPANQGKLYTEGLFSLARHINYGGFTLWRTGMALTSGNYWLAALQFTWHMFDFTKRGAPELGAYCSNRYGEQWKKYERDVPNILFPYIW